MKSLVNLLFLLVCFIKLDAQSNSFFKSSQLSNALSPIYSLSITNVDIFRESDELCFIVAYRPSPSVGLLNTKYFKVIYNSDGEFLYLIEIPKLENLEYRVYQFQVVNRNNSIISIYGNIRNYSYSINEDGEFQWKHSGDSMYYKLKNYDDSTFIGVNSRDIDGVVYPYINRVNLYTGEVYYSLNINQFLDFQSDSIDEYFVEDLSVNFNRINILVNINTSTSDNKYLLTILNNGQVDNFFQISSSARRLFNDNTLLFITEQEVINQRSYHKLIAYDSSFNKKFIFSLGDVSNRIGFSIGNVFKDPMSDFYCVNYSILEGEIPNINIKRFLVKINNDGDIMKKYIFNDESPQINISRFYPYKSYGYITFGNLFQSRDLAFIMKTDTCGNVEPGDWGVSFTQEDCGFVGVEDVIKPTESKIALYPNPNNGQFRMENEELGVVEVYNLQGQKVHSQRITQVNELINLNQPQSGVYLLRFIQENGTVKNAKFVVE